MEQTTSPRVQKIVKALQKAILSGRVSLEVVAARVAREPRTVSEWVSGFRPPPSTVLDALEEVLN